MGEEGGRLGEGTRLVGRLGVEGGQGGYFLVRATLE